MYHIILYFQKGDTNQSNCIRDCLFMDLVCIYFEFNLLVVSKLVDNYSNENVYVCVSIWSHPCLLFAYQSLTAIHFIMNCIVLCIICASYQSTIVCLWTLIQTRCIGTQPYKHMCISYYIKGRCIVSYCSILSILSHFSCVSPVLLLACVYQNYLFV